MHLCVFSLIVLLMAANVHQRAAAFRKYHGATRSRRFLSVLHSNDQADLASDKCPPMAQTGEAQADEVVKRRRVRYPDKYPKLYNQKYKEISGNSTVVEKVMQKGGTPAGQHISVMLKEVIECLNPSVGNDAHPGALVSVDCTLGYGGHSLEIIKGLLSSKRPWRHIMIDQDPVEIQKTNDRLMKSLRDVPMAPDFNVDSCLSFHHQNFGETEALVNAEGLSGKVDFLLADLGYSSMQIDDPQRGFTYKFSGPLDMRMDTSKGETAREYLIRVKRNELTKALEENSDETLALPIATAIKQEPIPSTTTELAERVKKAYSAALAAQRAPKPTKDELNSAVARTMQAVRIEVNKEFTVLEKLLSALPRLLAPGGRVAFLTFHSGEDRRVKKALKAGFNDGVYSSWSRDVVRAGSEERRSNPRSKCAKLRWAVRSSDAPPDSSQT